MEFKWDDWRQVATLLGIPDSTGIRIFGELPILDIYKQYIQNTPTPK